MTSAPSNPWIVKLRPNPRAALRLVCFPYAGGTASAFRTWPDGLPGDVEVLAIQPPGRETRSRERPFDQLAPLVTALVDAIAAQLTGPFAIYGHSLGSLIAFEFARELRRRGLGAPLHLFASGRRAPQIPDRDPGHELPDREFWDWLRRFGGMPDALFQEPELMAYFLPLLRADVAVNRSPIEDEAPLSCPITAMGGLADPRVTIEALDAWRVQTTAAFDRELFAGGHFYIQSARAEVLRSLSRRLARWRDSR